MISAVSSEDQSLVFGVVSVCGEWNRKERDKEKGLQGLGKRGTSTFYCWPIRVPILRFV